MRTAKKNQKRDHSGCQTVNNNVIFSGFCDVCGFVSILECVMISFPIPNIHFIKRKYRLNTTRKPRNRFSFYEQINIKWK